MNACESIIIEAGNFLLLTLVENNVRFTLHFFPFFNSEALEFFYVTCGLHSAYFLQHDDDDDDDVQDYRLYMYDKVVSAARAFVIF
jgi:hypothetical protein